MGRPLRDFYESLELACPPGAARVAGQLAQLRGLSLGPAGARRVLDVGCGDGTVAARVAAEVAGGGSAGSVVAMDWTAADTARARARGLSVVRASVDEAGLPFCSSGFDVVLMSEVVEHLVDPDLALAEARRVLRPGGALLLSTPNLAAWFNRALLAVGVQPVFSEVSRLGVFGRPGSQVVGHLRLFTSRALIQVLAAHGFVEVELAGASYHDVPPAARWLDRLMARRPSVAAVLLAVARTPAASR